MEPPIPAPIQLKAKIQVNHFQGPTPPRICQSPIVGSDPLLHFRAAFLLQGRDEAEEEQEQAGKAAETVTTSTAAARAVRCPPPPSQCRAPH